MERVVTILMKNDILSMYRQGNSIRSIARDLKISRNTVRRYIVESNELNEAITKESDKVTIIALQERLVGPPKRKASKRKRKFDGELKRRFTELMQEDENRDLILGPNKQKASASLIYRKLKSEGFDIGETTVRAEFNLYVNRNQEAFIKQQHEPGVRSEYDFHETKLVIDGKVRKIFQATITLPFSDGQFVKHYENQKGESFIDSIVSFFEHIGGVPQGMIFDNMRNVVARFLAKGDKQINEQLIKLSNYYGFKIMTTNPYRGNEKGHVEQAGKTLRKELFTFNYEFDSMADLRKYADEENAKCTASNAKLELEKQHLLPLPKVRYELGRLQQSKVNHESFIAIDGSFYSVPDSYVGKRVHSQVYVDYIMVFNDKFEQIASHNKKAVKDQYSANINHYLTTLAKKPGALANSLALKQSPKIYQALFHQYFSTKPREFIELIKDKTVAELSEIVNQLDNGYSITSCVTTIEEISINQLEEITQIFQQGVSS